MQVTCKAPPWKVRKMKNAFLNSIAVLALSLSACATTSTAVQAPEKARSALPEIAPEWTALQSRIQGEPVAWIASLNTPTLSALVQEAQTSSPDIKLAVANIRKARALTRQAGAALAPQIGAGLMTSSGGLVEGGSSSNLELGLNIAWEADLWGRLSAQKVSALQNLAAAEADFRGAKNLLAASIAQSYFLVVEAGLQDEIATKVVSSLSEINRIVQVRADNGMASQQDVALAKSDLAKARAQRSQIRGASRDALNALEVLVGRYPDASTATSAALPSLPALPPTGLPSDLLSRRPDLVAAERRIAAALGAVDAAKAAKLPSLNLTGSLGGASDDLSNILSPSNLAWTAVSSLVAPLFTGGALDAQVDLSSADVQAATAAYAKTVLTAFAEVEIGLNQSASLKDQMGFLETAHTQAGRADELVKLRYREGEADLLDVLTVQQKSYDIESQKLSLKRMRLNQYVALNLALGGDWEAR